MADRPQTFEQALAAINAECDEVMIRKQLDYGSENISVWGLLGIAVRSTDKVMRLKELLTSGREPKNESLRDTFVDLRNYATIGLMLMDGNWGLPVERK
ncbi:MAG TPA: hypothetical protein VIK75_04680 [Calditerricola sp.]